MTPVRAEVRGVLNALTTILRVHVALLLKLALLTIVGLILVIVAAGLYGLLIGPAVYARLVDLGTSFGSLTLITAAAITPILIVALLSSVLWVGVVVLGANARLARGRLSVMRALAGSGRRVLPALAVLATWIVGIALAVVLAPLITVAGIVMILVTRFTERRPRLLTLIVIAIPFGVAATLLVRWSLALPAVWLDRLGVRAALRASWDRVGGQIVRVVAVLGVTTLVTIAVTLGLQPAIAPLPLGSLAGLTSSLLSMLLVGPLPFVAAVVLYRSNSVAAKEVAPRSGSTRARVAALLIVAMVVPAAIVGGVAPAAEATGSTAVSFGIQADSSPVLAGVPSVIDFTVINAVTAEGVQPSGTLDISIDGTPLTGPFGPTSFGGTPYQLTQTFTSGDHLIEAHYSGDSMYAAADASLTLTVEGSSSTALATSAATAVYGNDVTLTATVTSASGTPTGSVEFYAANESSSAALLDTETLDGSGVATFHATTLLPNSNAVTARYLGAGGIGESTSTAQTVVIANAQTSTSFVVSPTSPSAAGASLTAIVVVVSTDSTAVPVGTASVYRVGNLTPLDTQPLVAGTVDLSFSLPPGLNGVTVSYSPGVGFASSDQVGTQTVQTYPSSVALSSSAATTVYGQSVDFTATITAGGTPAGTVTFTSGATVLGTATVVSGVATLTRSDLAVGGYSVVASYAGDSSTASNDSSALAHTVTKSDVDVTVGSSSLAPSYGDSITITVQVAATSPGSGTPGGTVTLSRDGSAIASGPVNFTGSASFTVSAGEAGSRSFSAAYGGDARFAVGTGALPLTVAQLTTTTHVVGDMVRGATYGTSQTYAGSVSTTSGIVPTGTVQLWAAGFHVADGTLDGTGRYSITTDRIPVGATPSGEVWLSYTGDTDFLASDTHNPTDTIQLTMSKYSTTPLLDFTGTAAIGGVIDLTATFATPAAGPSGLVTFSTVADGVIGTASVINGVATLPFTVDATTTQVTASYAGDGNFAATTTASPFVIAASGAAATIVLADPGTLEYGTLVTLAATVTLGDGSAPTGTVTFGTPGGGIFASNVAIDAGGIVRLPICAGDSLGCIGGAARLGIADQTIVVSYAGSSTHAAGLSNTVAYHVVDAATSTALVVNPTNIAQGSAVFLTATVTGDTTSATPRGSVAFYGVDPGGAEVFIAVAPLVSGVAMVTTQTGAGLTDLVWPAESVIARYTPASGFAESHHAIAVIVNRVPTTATVVVPTVVAFAPTTVQVNLSHDPGASAAFTGSITLTADTGATCLITLPASAPLGCTITWSTSGAHTVTAQYTGDAIYEPSDSGTTSVAVTKATPLLSSNIPHTVGLGTTVTATWRVFDATTPGTVTVTADGTVWCTVAVSVGQCSGTFASTGTVPVSVVFSGDSNWISIGDALTTTVTGCLAADVYSAIPAFGSVSIDTPPNCGSGYANGTTVTITAHPIAPYVMYQWQKLAPGLVFDTASLTTTFLITTDFSTWTHVASFALPCYALTPITGASGASVSPSPDCTNLDGTTGYSLGTNVVIYPKPAVNPATGDLEQFWYFTNLSGGTVHTDSGGQQYLTLTMDGPKSPILNYGQRCRVIKLTGATATTPPNCVSPFATGYIPNTVVTLAATPDATQALTGWTVDGTAAPALGSNSTPTVKVYEDDVTVRADYVNCYTLTVTLDGVRDLSNEEIGTVTNSPAPNCPDGGRRYLAGTAVTLTPTVSQAGISFRGWDDDSSTATVPSTAPGPFPAATTKKVTILGNLTLIASFYSADACSHLNILGDPSAVQFASTGCGPGFYYDQQKQWANRNKVSVSTLSQDKFLSSLTVTTPATTKLSVYASVKGYTGSCFGQTHSSSDAGLHYYGPLPRTVTDCRVGGDISLTLQQCQTIVSIPQFTVNGRSGTYGTQDLPSELYMQDPTTGEFGAYGVAGTNWGQAVPSALSVVPDPDPTKPPSVSLEYDPQTPGPCAQAGNAFPAGQVIAVYGLGAGVIFTQQGFAGSDGFQAVNPLITVTDTSAPALIVNPSYSLSCHTITLGEGISVIGDAPRCPGSSEADNSYITGAAIHVNALYEVGSRKLVAFTSGVASGQITEDSTTLDQSGYVIVDKDKSVSAEYVTKAQAFGLGIVKGLKIASGIAAVALPIMVGFLFPPAGILFTTLAAGAGIASFFPGGDKVAAVFDLVNPTKITECAARWAFDTSNAPTSGHNLGAIKKTLNNLKDLHTATAVATTAIADVKPATGISAVLAKALAKAKSGYNTVKSGYNTVKGVLDDKIGLKNLGTAAALASFGYELYDDGIGNITGGPPSVDQLRNTAGMTTCLDQQWRAAT